MAANNLVNTKAELIGSLVQRELINSASLMRFCTDLSRLATKGYNSISIPKLTNFTVQDRAFGAAATENAPLTDSKDTINLDKNKIVLFSYDSHDEYQSSIEYMISGVERASTAHGRDMNSEIVAMWENVAGLNVLAGVPADVSIDNILDMREFMLKNDADMGTVSINCAPDMEKAMLKLPEFSRYDYRGNGASPLVNGMIGTVYGISVYVNNAVKDGQFFMTAIEGSAVAFQKAPAVGESDDVSFGTGGKKVAVDATWGLGALQVGEGLAAAGKSPLVCKLID